MVLLLNPLNRKKVIQMLIEFDNFYTQIHHRTMAP